jgi:hypothetical protein
MMATRVARFFMLKNTKTGKNIPNGHKIDQIAINYNHRAVKYSK